MMTIEDNKAALLDKFPKAPINPCERIKHYLEHCLEYTNKPAEDAELKELIGLLPNLKFPTIQRKSWVTHEHNLDSGADARRMHGWLTSGKTLGDGFIWSDWFKRPTINSIIQPNADKTTFTPHDVFGILCQTQNLNVGEMTRRYWSERATTLGDGFAWERVFPSRLNDRAVSPFRAVKEFTPQMVFDLLRKAYQYD